MFYKKMSKIMTSLIIIVFLFVGVGCSSNNTSAKPTENPQQTTQTVSQNVEQTVYKTNSGKKYHKAGCKYLSKSSIPVTKTEAINDGLTPCSVCNP
jgi:PBP1b-binding outer membrane lipoprotein LpoB